MVAVLLPSIARIVGPMNRPMVVSYMAELNTRPSRNTLFTASKDTAAKDRLGRSDSGSWSSP